MSVLHKYTLFHSRVHNLAQALSYYNLSMNCCIERNNFPNIEAKVTFENSLATAPTEKKVKRKMAFWIEIIFTEITKMIKL
jgi:hypothetical protein